MQEDHLYLGIDLGTTNSAAYWGAVEAGSKQVEPTPLAFDQLIFDGRVERRVLLPSFIYYKPGENIPYVGEYARSMGLQYQPSRVARAIKNHMGQRSWRFIVDDCSFSAAELSGVILKSIYAGIKAVWGFPIVDTVITVPASFDSDMRKDTVEAARLAGFKIVENDGRPRNFILLDEPRAALYDLINMQTANKVPRKVLDLTSPKGVLVFDLGGGTLDVSLHKVSQDSSSLEISVQDYAISRYTQLGGGVFDALIADEFQRRFEERHKIKVDDLPETERAVLRFKLEDQAERAKINLTIQIQRRIDNGTSYNDIPENLSVDVQMPFLFDNKGLFTSLSKQDLRVLVDPLLGSSFTSGDVDKFANIDYSKANNIIYPVLDVLAKSHERFGKIPQIDAVILNGGMTRLHVVRERIQQFFNLEPITVLDPDKSVARGAAIYHFLLHRGLTPNQILAESIGVQVQGNRVYNLVKAGTVLPVKKEIQGLLAVADDASTLIRLPIFRGESLTPEPPNQKLAEPFFKLPKPFPLGTPIDIELDIDVNKVVNFIARLAENKVQVSIGEEGIAEEKQIVGLGRNGSEGKTNEPTRSLQKKLIPRPTNRPKPIGTPLEINSVRQEFSNLSKNPSDIQRIKTVIRRVLDASNINEIIEMLISRLDSFSRTGCEYAISLMGEYCRLFPEDAHVPSLLQVFVQHISPRLLNNPVAVTSIGRASVVAIGKMGSPIAESYLVNLMSRDNAEPIHPETLFALGKCGSSINIAKHINGFIESERVGERIAACWALGHIASREKEKPIPAADLDEIVVNLAKRAVVDPHLAVKKYAVYALGEICDQRFKEGNENTINSELADYVLSVLLEIDRKTLITPGSKPSEEEKSLRHLLDISLTMLRGSILTEVQIGSLAAIRSLASITGD